MEEIYQSLCLSHKYCCLSICLSRFPIAKCQPVWSHFCLYLLNSHRMILLLITICSYVSVENTGSTSGLGFCPCHKAHFSNCLRFSAYYYFFYVDKPYRHLYLFIVAVFWLLNCDISGFIILNSNFTGYQVKLFLVLYSILSLWCVITSS
jgi:hypothetical protein